MQTRFGDWIREMRTAFGDTPRKFDRHQKAHLSITKPKWMRFDFRKGIKSQYKDQDKLFQYGQVIWGSLIQANTLMFEAGDEDSPGALVYSLEGEHLEDIGSLVEIAEALMALKGEDLFKVSAELRSFAEMITDERSVILHERLPDSLTGGKELYYSILTFPRKHLADGFLRNGIFPILVAPEHTKACTVLPSRFWPEDFIELMWSDSPWQIDPTEEQPVARMRDAASTASRLRVLRAMFARKTFEEIIERNRRLTIENQPKGTMAEIWTKTFNESLPETLATLEHNGTLDAATQREMEELHRPVGEWSMQEIFNAHWSLEAIIVLEWALGLRNEIPDYSLGPVYVSKEEQPFPTENRVKLVDEGLLTSARLRPADTILDARETAETWLWRARTTQIILDGVKPPEGMDFDQIIEISAKGNEGEGRFITIENDYPAFGKPYRDLEEDEWCAMRSVATERLRALNWLCGYAEDWDEVPLGT